MRDCRTGSEGEGQRTELLRMQRVVAEDIKSLIGDYPREMHLFSKNTFILRTV